MNRRSNPPGDGDEAPRPRTNNRQNRLGITDTAATDNFEIAATEDNTHDIVSQYRPSVAWIRDTTVAANTPQNETARYQRIDQRLQRSQVFVGLCRIIAECLCARFLS
jgi:hypothetical protein